YSQPSSERQIEEIFDHIYRKVDATIGRDNYWRANKKHCQATDSALRNKDGTCIVAQVNIRLAGVQQ
ncbi:MAG TPA: hypothetical protein VFI97_09435, partial [Arthrobacter sp.]|nr:hypothetical protein [Arthrobacter sp.]